MKTPSTQRWILALTFLIAGSFSLLAQETTDRIVLIQKITNDDGTEMVIKKRIPSDEDLASALQEFKLDNADHVYVVISDVQGKDWEIHRRGNTPIERDPCQVFIGVTIGGQGPDGTGARVVGVIPNTSAETAGLRAGDVILRLDDAETNSHSALVHERDSHQPGDWYTLSILRDGQVIEVEAQFKACAPTPNDPISQQPVPEPPLREPNPDDPVLGTVDYSLNLQDFSAYPNPTYGEVHIRFQAEARPTTIRIADAEGKILFEEYRPDFDGYFARPVDLSNAQPGLILLTIQQADKIVSKKIILLART